MDKLSVFDHANPLEGKRAERCKPTEETDRRREPDGGWRCAGRCAPEENGEQPDQTGTEDIGDKRRNRQQRRMPGTEKEDETVARARAKPATDENVEEVFQRARIQNSSNPSEQFSIQK